MNNSDNNPYEAPLATTPGAAGDTDTPDSHPVFRAVVILASFGFGCLEGVFVPLVIDVLLKTLLISLGLRSVAFAISPFVMLALPTLLVAVLIHFRWVHGKLTPYATSVSFGFLAGSLLIVALQFERFAT